MPVALNAREHCIRSTLLLQWAPRDEHGVADALYSLQQHAANASIANYKGFALRVVIAYDNDQKQDVVSIDTLYGTKTLDANRAVLIHSGASS